MVHRSPPMGRDLRGPHPLSACATRAMLELHPGVEWPPDFTSPAGTPALLPDGKVLLKPLPRCPTTADTVSALGGTQALRPGAGGPCGVRPWPSPSLITPLSLSLFPQGHKVSVMALPLLGFCTHPHLFESVPMPLFPLMHLVGTCL